MRTCLCILVALCAYAYQGAAFAPRLATLRRTGVPSVAKMGSLTTFARRRGDLFDELNEMDADSNENNAPKTEDGSGAAVASAASEKAKAMLEPETVFFEGPPSWTEVVLPAVSILTVLGIIPFIATVTRQFWVNYKITSRRISVQSGFQGKDLTEITYDEIYLMKFVYRAFGSVGDMVIELRDGAKLEMRSVPNFAEVYQYIFDRVDDEVREYSDKLTPQEK